MDVNDPINVLSNRHLLLTTQAVPRMIDIVLTHGPCINIRKKLKSTPNKGDDT